MLQLSDSWCWVPHGSTMITKVKPSREASRLLFESRFLCLEYREMTQPWLCSSCVNRRETEKGPEPEVCWWVTRGTQPTFCSSIDPFCDVLCIIVICIYIYIDIVLNRSSTSMVILDSLTNKEKRSPQRQPWNDRSRFRMVPLVLSSHPPRPIFRGQNGRAIW